LGQVIMGQLGSMSDDVQRKSVYCHMIIVKNLHISGSAVTFSRTLNANILGSSDCIRTMFLVFERPLLGIYRRKKTVRVQSLGLEIFTFKIWVRIFRVDIWYILRGCWYKRYKLEAFGPMTTILCKLALLRSLRTKMNDILAWYDGTSCFLEILYIVTKHMEFS
jgi:hypothetical protein